MVLPNLSKSIWNTLSFHLQTKLICVLFFLAPLVFYLLNGFDQIRDRPQTLDVGVVAVAAVLGGLVLNAGLNLDGPKRIEFIRVAQ